MAQAKRKPTPVAAETVPGSFIIDPAQVPERYALIVQGDCMAPLHRDGDVVTAEKSATYSAGDLVVIYIKPELVKPGRCNAMLKRLVSIPHWAASFPFTDHPDSEVIAIATVETLNPPRRLHFPCKDILAIHRCTGAAPVEILSVSPHVSRVHASDVTKAKPSRRTILAGIAASPALAAPALALTSNSAEGQDTIAALARFEQVMETLRTRYICAGWKVDERGASHALRYMRLRAAGIPDDPEDGTEYSAVSRFLFTHGQSTDWVIDGDPTGMMCTGASRSQQAALVAGPDPIFAAIEHHKALNAAFTEVLRGMSEFEVRHGVAAAGIDEWYRREHETSNAERDACDEMIATAPTTLPGLLALLRYVEGEHDRGEKILDERGLEELLSATVATLGAVS